MLKRDCDLSGRLVGSGAVAAAIPIPGSSLAADTLDIDGSHSVALTTSPDGQAYDVVVTDVDRGDGDAGVDGSASSPAACSDTAYVFTNPRYKMTSQLSWLYNPAGQPSNLTTTRAASGIKAGADALVLGQTDCAGFSMVPRSSETYAGTTGLDVNIDGSNSTCYAADGASVQKFGYVPSRPTNLALTCTAYSAGSVTSADTRYNTYNAWDDTFGDGCYGGNSRLLGDISAHEWGHIAGLDHVDEAAHGNLTMSPILGGPCRTSNTEITLGQGDLDGMLALYGAR